MLLTNRIKNTYFAERIQSRELQTDLDQSSPLVGFPSKAVIGSSILFTPHLEEDFRRVAVVAAFLEAVRNDEASSINPTFLDSLDLLESQLYPFLCQLYNAMYDRSVTDLPRVTRNVIMFTDRNMGSAAERYSRDYRILKDTDELFHAINNGFMIFLNDHNS